ncbi:MAG: lysophospholipid acyltransferase family protein [Candidatus Adiutrix sp.]|nr:lysophospholipid acyltransferase family protein [Candidatus Adiutrix sp.]
MTEDEVPRLESAPPAGADEAGADAAGADAAMAGDEPEEPVFFMKWPRLAARFLMLSAKFVRTRIVGYPDLKKTGPVIFAHWHSEDLSMLPHFGHSRACILISPSRDGAALSQAASVMGYGVCRGSSSRGGLGALLVLKRNLEGGASVIFAADGPRGPRMVAKPGPIFLAAKTGCPIYPVGTAGSLEYVFKKSWNRTRFQLPGSKLAVVFGPPLFFSAEASRWPVMEQSRLLGAAIADAAREAELALEKWRAE